MVHTLKMLKTGAEISQSVLNAFNIEMETCWVGDFLKAPSAFGQSKNEMGLSFKPMGLTITVSPELPFQNVSLYFYIQVYLVNKVFSTCIMFIEVKRKNSPQYKS